MHVVVVTGVVDESAVTALAAVLGRSGYEARGLARLTDGGPGAVGKWASEEEAASWVRRLASAGFAAFQVTPSDLGAEAEAFVVREFELGGAALRVRGTRGRQAAVPYAAVDLLVRGTRFTARRETKTHRTRKLALGRALVTGGLMLTKSVTRQERRTVEESEPFLRIYASGQPPFHLARGDLHYASLGEALAPSTAANFNHLVDELRRRATGAAYDDRLVTRGGFTRLLGPSFRAEDHLDVATAVLARTLRHR